jgi:CHAD domain-containing protein
MAPRRSSNLLRSRLSTLLDAMPAAQAGDETSVHQARVASRRLREALPVAAAGGGDDALRRAQKQVRRVTRALGPVREIDVALAHLTEFAERGSIPARAVVYVRRGLERERRARRIAMLEALQPVELDKLRRRVAHLQSGDGNGRTPESALAAAVSRVERRAVRLNDAMEHAGAIFLADRLHAVRVAAKKLRYALEIHQELRRSRATARVEQLKGLQDLLGRLHDLDVLIDRVRASQAEAAVTDRKSAEDLDRLVRLLEEEGRQLHATYVARRPGFAKLCAALAAESAADHRLAPA